MINTLFIFLGILVFSYYYSIGVYFVLKRLGYEKAWKAFIPFYAFYDTVHTFLDGAVRRVIDRADRAALAGDGLKPQDVDVLKLLFLIRYVEGVPSNIENLSTLMITSLHADKIAMRQQLQELEAAVEKLRMEEEENARQEQEV